MEIIYNRRNVLDYLHVHFSGTPRVYERVGRRLLSEIVIPFCANVDLGETIVLVCDGELTLREFCNSAHWC